MGHKNYVMCVAFSPRGTVVASGSFDESVALWDVARGKQLRSIPAHSEPVTMVDFNADGTLLATSSYDGLCRVWDVATGQCLQTLMDEGSPPTSFVRFSPNGKYLLTSALDSVLRLWDVPSGKRVRRFTGHRNERYSCFAAFRVYGKEHEVVSGSDDGTIVRWDLHSAGVVQRLEGHGDAVTGLDVHPDGRTIASSSLEKDRTINIWRVGGAKR